jgi:lipopolysaccharide/colanic/teichoic acid biosynthesis glycosyltransferase
LIETRSTEREESKQRLAIDKRPVGRLIKRLLDVFGAVLGLLVVVALLPVIGLAVAIDSRGPVIYRQTRTGRDGKTFRILKIRTMAKGAENGVAQWAVKDDSRVTRLGRFLRKTRLDELPQLWNVLLGDMSLVGPRPERPEIDAELDRLIPGYMTRYRVRPGLAGWAAIRGPYVDHVEKARQRQEMDLWYIENWSISLDLRIILSALRQVALLRGQ